MSNEGGMRLETAASVVLEDFVKKHMAQFGLQIRTDRTCNASVVAVYASALAGATALTIAGGHGPRNEVTEAAIKAFRTAVERDLSHLARS
jgi:hypothetical protein